MNGREGLVLDFAHGLDALGAHRLLNHLAVSHHRHFLQIRAEFAAGAVLGVRDVLPKDGSLATVSALHGAYFLY